MKKPLLISVTALALLTLSATLFAQTATGSSLITQMKAAVHDFTLATTLNPGVTDLKSGPVSGKKTGDMLTAEEYNRILELVGQGGGGGSDGGFTTTLFDDITDGLANGGVKTYTCPQNQYVLSVTSIMVPSGQYSCANSPNADKKSVSYNSCAALTGQRWHTHVICGGGGGGGGGTTPATTGKICRFVYTAGGGNLGYLNSHMHTVSAGSGWTSETCRSYLTSTKGGATETYYILGCISDTGFSYGTSSAKNPTTADAGIPTPNCGW